MVITTRRVKHVGCGLAGGMEAEGGRETRAVPRAEGLTAEPGVLAGRPREAQGL